MTLFSGPSLCSCILLSILLTPAFYGCAHQQKDKINKENIDQYVQTANTILDSTQKLRPSSEVTQKAQELLSSSVNIIKDYIERHPDCKKYLDLVLSFKDLMPTLKLEEIKGQFYEGEALPSAADKCVNAKDLLVRPATVIILASGHYDEAGREMIKAGMKDALEGIKKLD